MMENKKAIEVVAGLVRKGDCVLICRRPMNKARGGQWEFAGGKVEQGETKQQALVREFREELDVELKAGEVLLGVTHCYPDLTVHLSLLEATVARGEPRALEHSEIRWVKIEEIHAFDLCPADRELVSLLHEKAWLHEQEIAQIHGWDFSHIDGRCIEEEDLPWNYRETIDAYRRMEHRMLDIDTGGGEFLLSLGHPCKNTAATEGYAPNVELCREKLIPLGIDFRAGHGDKLPFGDECFDLVINRHGDFDAGEIHRVLKPGGLFITQQVGAENDRELVELLMPGTPMPFPEQHLSIAQQKFAQAGFDILDAQEAFRPIRFLDVDALVWFARIIEWEFPGFEVEKCLGRLHAAQKLLEKQGFIEGRMHRFLLVAKKQ